ncbi:MAG TPA: hypothetical protein VHO50_01825 [Bacteroidales bacterium]|nr:hypothetical protein [Bacteroidales bacterium]
MRRNDEWTFRSDEETKGQGGFWTHNTFSNFQVSNLHKPVFYYSGVYGGYYTATYDLRSLNQYNYGIKCNFQLLPFLIKKHVPKFDLYLSGKFGGKTIKGNIVKGSKTKEYHSIGAGTAFYLFNHVGVFGEYEYGKLNNININIGLSVRFR